MKILDSDDDDDDDSSVQSSEHTCNDGNISNMAISERLGSIHRHLSTNSDIPIFTISELQPKIRVCPLQFGVDARKGKMAADIEYPMDHMEMDNQVLDKVMYQSWRLGAIFYVPEQRPRQGRSAQTSESKVSRVQREEMLEQYFQDEDVVAAMHACFTQAELEVSHDGKALLKVVHSKLAALELGDKNESDNENRESRKANLMLLKTNLSQQREVQRAMALKRRERRSVSYVFAMPGPYPVNGTAWVKRVLARTAVSTTRKVKTKECDMCKANGGCYTAWYNAEGLYCQIVDDSLYIDSKHVEDDVEPHKLEGGEYCVHAYEEEMREFAYGHQTDRVPMMRLVRSEAMMYLNEKILADYRFELRNTNKASLVSDDPFGIYFKPASLLVGTQNVEKNIAVVGSLGDGYMLFSRRLYEGSFYEAMKKLAQGHLKGTLHIDDAVGAHEFLSGDVERVCEWIVYPNRKDRVYSNVQAPIWWMIGLCELVSSTCDGRELLKQCGLTVFDRDLCSLLYDYARSEINRREKDQNNEMRDQCKRRKKEHQATDAYDRATILSASTNHDPNDSDSDHGESRGDVYEDKDGCRVGNSSDPYRAFQWWIQMNEKDVNSTLLMTIVSETSAQQKQAGCDVLENQISSVAERTAANLTSSSAMQDIFDGFLTNQTRVAGLTNCNYNDQKQMRPIPTVRARDYASSEGTVSVTSTMRVDEEVKYSAVFLCNVARRDANLAILHTRGFTPLHDVDEESGDVGVDHVYKTRLWETERALRADHRRALEKGDATCTARGVNRNLSSNASSYAALVRSERIGGIHEQRQLHYTSTNERPCTMIVIRMMLLHHADDHALVGTMMKTKGVAEGTRFHHDDKDPLHEPCMAPNSPLGVSLSSIHTIAEAYGSHHRSIVLAGHAEWGQPLSCFDQICRKSMKDGNKRAAKSKAWEEFASMAYASKAPKSKQKTRRRGCPKSDAKVAKTTPPPCTVYNDVRIERIGEMTTETICTRSKTVVRTHAPYAVTFQIPMQNAVRLIDKLGEFKKHVDVKARHLLALMCVATIKALDTNELAREKNAGEKDVMRKNARGTAVNDCNTDTNTTMEDVLYGGINNLTPTFSKTHRKGCYEWIPHGSGPMGADAGNRLSDQRKLGRSLHEGETSAEIYKLQREHFFHQVGDASSMEFDTRPDALKFMPFGVVVGVTTGANTYYEAKKLLDATRVVSIDTNLLPILMTFPLSPDTQSVAPYVNPGNFDSGSKLSMGKSRVHDFNTMGRADNVNATDEIIALLNPEDGFRPPSSQSCIDMAKTDMVDYGSTFKALHTLVARITKELIPQYDTRGVDALLDLVNRFRDPQHSDRLSSDQRVVASTVLVLLNLCNPRDFGVAKPVITRMYAIVAAITAWEDAHGTASERGTLPYWMSRLSPEEVAEEKTWFEGYFCNGPDKRGAWNSVVPLYEAILARDGHHFQSYAEARAFNALFADALRQGVWYASSPDGVNPPPPIDGQVHPLENVKGPDEIRRRHLEPVYVGRTIRTAKSQKQYVETRGATFCIESFQATQILTLLNSASSIPLIDPNGTRGYGVQVYRNTGGMNVRPSVDANIQYYGYEPKSKKRGAAVDKKSKKRKLMWRSAKSTSIDQLDHDEIQNGTPDDRRLSHMAQRIAANHNIRALATTVSILNPPLPENERMRGAEVSNNKPSKHPPVEDVDDLKKAIVHPQNIESMRRT